MKKKKTINVYVTVSTIKLKIENFTTDLLVIIKTKKNYKIILNIKLNKTNT